MASADARLEQLRQRFQASSTAQPVLAAGARKVQVSTRRVASVELPVSAHDPVRLTDLSSKLGIAFVLRGARASARRELTSDGIAHYTGAFDGNDVVQRPTSEGIED